MALRFIDSGGDYYSTAQIGRKWPGGATTGGSINAAGGRRGSNGLNMTNATYHKPLDAQGTWIVGLALLMDQAPFNSTCIPIALYDGVTEQLSLRLEAVTAKLIVSRNGTTLATSAAGLTLDVFNYIEFKAVISDAAGSYEVRVNGVNVLSASSVDTKNTANATADNVRFSVAGTNGTNIADDIYICDGTGAANNNFLGDVRVDAKLPDGAGTHTDFTPSAGSNFQCVDENPATDDTDYVQSTTVNHVDTYTFGDITHIPVAIFGVQVIMTARKDDAGVRSIAGKALSGGTMGTGATQALATTYTQYREIFENDPNTAAAWTKTALNAAEFGIEVAA